jgi:methionyl-tRNA formyltransferase
MKNNITFAFFGTSHIAVFVLDALHSAGLLPSLIVTIPGKIDSAVAMWAKRHTIPLAYDWQEFETGSWDVAVVVDYGKILPKRLLDIPAKGFVNVHPSLLPRLRGPSPIRTAILQGEEKVGVSIMLVDEEMDHGPIIAQKAVAVPDMPLKNSALENLLLTAGGKLLCEMLPKWVFGEIEAQPQNHDVATYTGKFTKDDGLLDLSADARTNLRKICALETWPGTFAYFERPSTRPGQAAKKIRVAILDAHIENGALIIDTVKPEGKKEMPYKDFLLSGAKPIQ